MTQSTPVVISELAVKLADIHKRTRAKLRIQPSGSTKSVDLDVLGVIYPARQVIVSAPASAEGKLTVVRKGDLFTCHWVNSSYVFRLTATVAKVELSPIPLLYLQLVGAIDRREVRSLPRALVSIKADLRTPETISVLVVDLSVGGCRIAAVRNPNVLIEQSKAELVLDLPVLSSQFSLTLNCNVTSRIDAGGPTDGDVQYFGLQFETPSEKDLLVIHGYVQERLALELDALSHLLTGI